MGRWDPELKRYVTGTRTEDLEPMARSRRERQAVARDHIELQSPRGGIAEAARPDEDPVRGAALQMMALTEAGADPEAISARLASDRAEYGVDEESNPDLVQMLASDVDDETASIAQEREAGEAEEAFESWVEERFGVEELREHLAGLDEQERHEFVDALVEAYAAETGQDVLDVPGTDDLEPDFEPYSDDGGDEADQ